MEIVGIGSDIVECVRIGRMIERHGDQHEIVDPLFAAWIARGAEPPD